MIVSVSRMYVEMVYVESTAKAQTADIVELVKKAADIEGRVLILDCQGC